ncbi:hypothetical protein [Aquincola tertiaricarbonis]|uniref:hypothetical protein n=1 Tax=Aquincola tertiaricarbonis TaxID=391953 RepID=UPI00061525A1|nr:hypothetical protein [Aquincola tertiaricarbonis]
MTQLPAENKSWPGAGADDKPAASGEQIRTGGQPAPAAPAGQPRDKDDPHLAPESGDKPDAAGR